MRTNNVYTIYDTVAEDTGPLFEAPNDATAVRLMLHTMRNVENTADYKLVHIGEIERDETGKVVLLMPCGNREINVVISQDRKFATIEVNNE